MQRGFSSLNLKGQFSAFTNPIDEAALDGLDFCSDFLSRQMPEKVLDHDVLKSIYDDTAKLIEKIIEGDIDGKLKKFMLEQLDQVVSAIQEYKINGTKPIERVVGSTFGAIAIHENIYNKTMETEQHRKEKIKDTDII